MTADHLPRFLGCDMRQTLGNHYAYVERWMPGSRARARVAAMRGVGLHPTTSQVKVNVAGFGVLEMTEIRVEPAPSAATIPAVPTVDVLPTVTTKAQRAAAARMRASIETGE